MIRKTLAECKPHEDPIERPDYTEAEVQAIRALWDGNATDRQQRMALEYILRAAGTQDMPFRPDNPHATYFACGKMWVGQTIIWMLKAAPTKTDPDKIAVRHVEEENG